MRRLALLAFLGAAALVQSASATAVAPQSLVLRRSDVPATYRLNQDESGRRTIAQDSVGSPGLGAKYARWGHLGGYQIRFDEGSHSIVSRVDVLRGRAGASQMLSWFVAQVQRQGILHLRPTSVALGDEGVAYSWAQGSTRFTFAVWRYGRVFSVVAADGLARTRVLDLATTQQRRVAAALS